MSKKAEKKFYKSESLFSLRNNKQLAVKEIHDPRGSLNKFLYIVLLIPHALYIIWLINILCFQS
jgi:hypothetical protein